MTLGDFITMIWPLLFLIGKILLLVVPLLICVAMLTYWERKIIAAIQDLSITQSVVEASSLSIRGSSRRARTSYLVPSQYYPHGEVAALVTFFCI